LVPEAVRSALKGQDGFPMPKGYVGWASFDTLLGSVCLCASEGRNPFRSLYRTRGTFQCHLIIPLRKRWFP